MIFHTGCATCNDSILQEEAKFNLYAEKVGEVEPFWFELTPDKAMEVYVDQDMDKLEVRLNSNDKSLLKNHQDLFHIDLIYAQHIDVEHLIIVMLRANSEYYMQSLRESLAYCSHLVWKSQRISSLAFIWRKNTCICNRLICWYWML